MPRFHKFTRQRRSLLLSCVLLGLGVTAVSSIHGCKKRRNQSSLQQSPEDQAKTMVQDLAIIDDFKDKAQANGWATIYLDLESLSETNLPATMAATEFSAEEKLQGWTIAKQIKGIVGLSLEGRFKLEKVAELIAKYSARKDGEKVVRSGAYFISWLLHEIGVYYEVDAIDTNLQALHGTCNGFTECIALITAVAAYGDIAPGPVIRYLVGDKAFENCGASYPPSSSDLVRPRIWECLIKDGLPTASKVSPDSGKLFGNSLYHQVFTKIQSPILRDILTFHLHSLLLNTIFYGEIANADKGNDEKRKAMVRTSSGKVPSLDDETKALIQSRITDLKAFHQQLTFPDNPPAPPLPVDDPEKTLAERLTRGLQTLVSSQTVAEFLASVQNAVSEEEMHGAVGQDIRRGLIRGLEGVLSIELYLGRLGLREIRPWLEAVKAASTEVAFATLARNMKTEATLPSAQFYNRAFARLIQASPKLTLLDFNNVPREHIRDDYRALLTSFDMLAGMHRGMMFGTYGLQSIADVERTSVPAKSGLGVPVATKENKTPTPKNRAERGGFFGVFVSTSTRSAEKYEVDKGCKAAWTDAEVEQTYFLAPGTKYRKLSVTDDANAAVNADYEDSYEKTVGAFAVPRLKAFEQDLANRFPEFNSMTYQSNIYTRANSLYALFQTELLKIFDEEQKKLKGQGTVPWVFNGTVKFGGLIADGLTMSVTWFVKLFDFPQYFGNTWYYDPNLRNDQDTNIELQSKSEAAMKNYLHQFLALNCYNFMTLDDAGFRKNPTVCAPNGFPYKLANICLGLSPYYRAEDQPLPPQWTQRWNSHPPDIPPLNIELVMSNAVEKMTQAESEYQINRRIAETIITIPVVMVSGAIGSWLVGGVTGAIAGIIPKVTTGSGTVLPLLGVTVPQFVKLKELLAAAPLAAVGHLTNASINMAAFAVVHKAILWTITTVGYQDLAGANRAFYDADKSFYENFGKELASGSFMFFIQPVVGKATDWMFAKIFKIASPEHFHSLGKGVVGFTKYQELFRQYSFVGGTVLTDSTFFFAMPYIERTILETIGLEKPGDTPANAKTHEEFANSFAMAAAFRVHGNLGGHFSLGPYDNIMVSAHAKYMDSLARYRKTRDQWQIDTRNIEVQSAKYLEAVQRDQHAMEVASAKLNKLLKLHAEATMKREKGPDGKYQAPDLNKSVDSLLERLHLLWNLNNPSQRSTSFEVDMQEFKNIPVGAGGEDIVP